MKTCTLSLAALLLAATLGCNDSTRSQDNVRHETAAATATVASDVKAVAEGVRDGLRESKSVPERVNLNTASRRDLETLPGVDVLIANDIIRHRPYRNPADLMTKSVLTRDQYDKLSDRVKTIEQAP